MPQAELSSYRVRQRYELLAFLGSRFFKTQAGRTSYEKTAFAIYQAYRKLDYLVAYEENLRTLYCPP